MLKVSSFALGTLCSVLGSHTECSLFTEQQHSKQGLGGHDFKQKKLLGVGKVPRILGIYSIWYTLIITTACPWGCQNTYRESLVARALLCLVPNWPIFSDSPQILSGNTTSDHLRLPNPELPPPSFQLQNHSSCLKLSFFLPAAVSATYGPNIAVIYNRRRNAFSSFPPAWRDFNLICEQENIFLHIFILYLNHVWQVSWCFVGFVLLSY